ncbi:MAG: negative regulator of flagellin synthesis FlgM [Petrotoga sp.]|jgi:negative regulator of flagellin synthesis FlgM|nr:negative regulator of flagellin synthesis FlgM [Petrotoga sp.]
MDINNINPADGNNLDKINQKKLDKDFFKRQIKSKSLESANKITGESKKYIELSNKIPEIRRELVSKLKESIESGSYNINVDQIVNKMFE